MRLRQRVEGASRRWIGGRKAAGRWAGRGLWAIADQGLFALSNFALNVILARWLTPAEYGAFAVIYAVFLLIGTFHSALLTEPMLVFGSGKYRERLRFYLGVLLHGHWVFGALVGALFAASGLVLWRFGDSSLAPAVFALAGASPFILFGWIMRRACYVDLRPHMAASSGAIYMVIMAVGVIALHWYGMLAAPSALMVMAIASLVAGLWLVRRTGADGSSATAASMRGEALHDHWNYGRWAVGTAVLMWVPGNAFLLALPVWWNLDAAAAYRARLPRARSVSSRRPAVRRRWSRRSGGLRPGSCPGAAADHRGCAAAIRHAWSAGRTPACR